MIEEPSGKRKANVSQSGATVTHSNTLLGSLIFNKTFYELIASFMPDVDLAG